MNAEVKQKWVAALRSGEFNQVCETLRDDADDGTSPCFCCLGVLCELAARDGVIKPWNGLYDGAVAELPESVRTWAELDDSCGNCVDIGEIYQTLAEHNDDGCTFSAIADAIEAQL